MKIVINCKFGGFHLTDEMMEYIGYVKTSEWDEGFGVRRTNPKLIEFLETTPSSKHGSLKVVEIPDDVEWVIEDYDGLECVAEKHRTWR